MEKTEEKDLLIAVAKGSEVAFRKLYHRYHHKLGAFIFRLTDSREISEEIVQDVFLKIWQNKESLSSINSFKAYLFIISKNQSLNWLKKAVADRAKFVKLESFYEEICNLTESASDETSKYILLDEAIENLPEQQKKAFILSRHQRLSYVEIAKEMRLSPETVKKYIKIATSTISNRVKENSQYQLVILSVLYFS